MSQKTATNIELPAINSPSTQSEIKKPSFWVSQLFILMATILGVYLAATQGFKQAMQFDHITNQKNIYYLQQSLKNEIESNLSSIELFIDESKNASDPWKAYPLETSSFIWHNMQEAPISLQLQPTILQSAEKIMTNIPKAYETATTGTLDQRKKGIQELEMILTLGKNTLIPDLDIQIQQLTKSLDKANIQY
ncbi:hypothetical protein [Ignatzschineria sp. LJL83]